MTDVQPPIVAPPITETRTLVIIVYGLYLAGAVTFGAAGLVGVILAYIKRDEARGTVWETHFNNAIETFWIWFALYVVGWATTWLFFVGFLVIAAAFVYFLYRTIRGLLAALDSRPYIA
ncbi:MAG: hypothetical protein WDM91_14375 [Rhizomicrobium sp.]